MAANEGGVTGVGAVQAMASVVEHMANMVMVGLASSLSDGTYWSSYIRLMPLWVGPPQLIPN